MSLLYMDKVSFIRLSHALKHEEDNHSWLKRKGIVIINSR